VLKLVNIFVKNAKWPYSKHCNVNLIGHVSKITRYFSEETYTTELLAWMYIVNIGYSDQHRSNGLASGLLPIGHNIFRTSQYDLINIKIKFTSNYVQNTTLD